MLGFYAKPVATIQMHACASSKPLTEFALYTSSFAGATFVITNCSQSGFSCQNVIETFTCNTEAASSGGT